MNKIVRSRSKGRVPDFSLTNSFISGYHDNIRPIFQNQYCKIVVENKNFNSGLSPRRNKKRKLN